MLGLKEILKTVKSLLEDSWRTASVHYSFYKRHKAIYNNGEFVRVALTRDERKEYLTYWRKVSPLASTKTVEISKSFSGRYNKYIVPEEVYALNIERELNPRPEVSFLKNKSFYNKWFRDGRFPVDYLYGVDGLMLDSNYNPVLSVREYFDAKNIGFPVVFKPSVDSYGGEGVEFVSNIERLQVLLAENKNYVVQELIVQSNCISLMNETINTVRVCLYKTRDSYAFEVLNASLRMGVDGSLDNATAGGIVCNINDDGVMNDYAVNKYGIKVFAHPNTGYVFSGKFFPFYKDLIDSCIEIANQVPNTRILSLDMCLDKENNWRCIEISMFGQTIRFSQYAGNPFFGHFANEIVQELAAGAYQ